LPECAQRLALVALLVASVVAPATAGQLFVPAGRDTLRALPGVEVIVETVPPPLVRAGVAHATVVADVVKALEAGRVPIYASQSVNPSPAKAYLTVRLTALAPSAGAGYPVAIQLQLRQTLASLVTESRVVNAVTWESGTLVSIPASNMALLRQELMASVREFVDDWQAMH
jgi:hypothetical protein